MDQKHQRNILKSIGVDFSNGYDWDNYNEGFLNVEIDTEELIALGYKLVSDEGNKVLKEQYSNGKYVISIDHELSEFVRVQEKYEK